MNAKKTLSLLIFFCMVTPSVFVVLPGGPLPLVSATSSNQTGTGTAPGTPLAPGTVTYQNTVNDTPKIVQKSVASLPSFEFNSTGLYWGSGNDSMELQLPILTIATSTATCATLESATLTHNSTTYTYSFAGASACSGLALTISYNLYVNNLTGTDNKEVSVIGTIDKVGSGSFNNIISFPLTLPSNFVLNTNSDSVNAGSVGFNWQDMSSFSPTWNGTTNSIDVSTGSSSAGIVKFSIDPTLVQSQSDACSSNSCSASFGSSVTAGDTIVAIAGFEYGSGYPSFSITDNSGDTFNVARQEYYGCCVGTAIWYATDVVGGSVTVTDSVTGGAGTLYNNGIFIYEISPSILGNTAVGVGASLNPATSSMSFGSNSILFSGVSAGGTAQYIAKDGTSWSYMYVLASTSHGDGTAGGAYSTTASSPTTFEWTLPYYAEAYAAVGVEFQAAPVPSATISSPSWSKAGLSPFENYFTGESEYVSPGNGLLGIEQTDYSLAGKGLDLAITRVYSQPYAFIANSPYLYDNYTLSNLGLGWQLNFPWMGADYLHLSDGEVYQYNWTGNSFLNSLGTPFVLLNNSGSYDLHLVSGIDYHFNSAKQLESITDSTGNNTITFSYGTNGYISKITDTASRNITFTYNGNDQLSTVATGEGNFYYNYSGDNLVSVTDPAGRVTGYNYSTGINDWLVSSISYPTGAHTNYTYNSSSYGVEKIYYVTSQNIYVQGTTLDKSTSYNYNITNGQVQYCNSTISDGSTTQGYINYVFNSSGKSTEVEKNSTGSIIQSLENDYDSMGRINETKILSPTGSVLAYSVTHYDNWSNVIYTRSYTGQQTWYSFANTNTTNAFEDGASGFDDSFYTNNTISSNIHDLLVGQAYWQNSVGTSNNIETYYNYNSAGELIHEKQLNSTGWQVSSYTYDDYGNQMTSTDPLGRTTYNQYSSTYDHVYLTQSSIEVSGKNISTTFDYTFATGTLSSQTDPNNQTTSYTYDSIGRLTSISYPLVNHVYSYTRYTYNDTGNYLVTTDPNGNNVTDQFDGLGRLVSVITYNGSSIYSTENYTYNYLNSIATKTMPTGSVYSYTYDFLGFQTKTTNPDSSTITYSYNYSNNTETTIDENGHETQYAYDWGHNLLWVKQWNGSSTYYKTSYSYDLTGNLISTTDAKNQETTYTYDNLNRLIQTNYPDGTNQTATYDAVGNVVSTKDPAGNVINYKYDSLNRLLNTTYPDNSSVTYTYDANGNKLSEIYNLSQSYFSYDARNRMINQTDVINGNTFTTLYSYDKASNIASMEYPGGYNLTYTYDPMERVAKVGAFANFTYTLDNNIASISYANGVKTTYLYNSRDEPTNITSMDGSTKVMSLNYTYDSAGNTLKMDNQNYSYNDLNQMTTGNGTWGTIIASYDPAGNMVQSNSNGAITNYTYGSYNRLTSIGAVNFTYNANGDTIKLVNGSDTSTYNYDYANRLTSVVANGVTLENDSYDGGTNLVYSVAGIYKTYLVYQGLDIIYTKTKWGLLHNSIIEDIYANGLHVAKMVGSTTYFYLLDSQGSTRLVTTGSTITFATSYIPFGANYSTYGSELFMYTGKPFDSTIGLYYYSARDYLASIGRFMTEDTETGKLTDPLSQNRYIYADDNPLKYVDPTGHRFETSSGGGGSSTSTTTPPPTHGIAPPPPSPVPNPPPAPPLPSSSQSGTSSTASSGTSSSGSTITTTTTSTQTFTVTSTSATSSVGTINYGYSIGPREPTSQPPCGGITASPGQGCAYPGQAQAQLVTLGFALSVFGIPMALGAGVYLATTPPEEQSAWGAFMAGFNELPEELDWFG